MPPEELNRRERRVLEAVIRSYVETAEPAGSRTLSRRFGLGVSPATIRNTMSDLEAKGFLFHPHTSAGRVPTDKAYRAYVDSLLTRPPLPAVDTVRLSEGLGGGHGNSSSPIESILRRAAQTLGLLTQEGLFLPPSPPEGLVVTLFAAITGQSIASNAFGVADLAVKGGAAVQPIAAGGPGGEAVLPRFSHSDSL